MLATDTYCLSFGGQVISARVMNGHTNAIKDVYAVQEVVPACSRHAGTYVHMTSHWA